MQNNNKKNHAKRGRGRRIRNSAALLPHVSTPPRSQRILSTYINQVRLTESAAGVGTTYFYRLNSVYDPDATGTGAVATGYNTWSTLFLNYKVRRVTVRLEGYFSGLSASAFGNVTMAPVAYQMVVPTGKQTWKMIPGAVFQSAPNQTNGGPTKIKMAKTFDNARIARLTKQQYEVDLDWSGQVGANPVRQNYLMIAADSVNSSTVCTFDFNIIITYETEWFNPSPMQ